MVAERGNRNMKKQRRDEVSARRIGSRKFASSGPLGLICYSCPIPIYDVQCWVPGQLWLLPFSTHPSGCKLRIVSYQTDIFQRWLCIAWHAWHTYTTILHLIGLSSEQTSFEDEITINILLMRSSVGWISPEYLFGHFFALHQVLKHEYCCKMYWVQIHFFL